MILNWVVRWPCKKGETAVLQTDPDRREEWSGRNSMKFNKDKCKVLHLGRNNQRAQYRLRSCGWGAALLKGTWVSWWTTSWTWVSSALLLQQRQMRSWAASSEALLAEGEMWSSPLHSVLVRLHLEYCVSSGAHIQKRHGQTGEGQRRVHKDEQRAGECALWGKMERVRSF